MPRRNLLLSLLCASAPLFAGCAEEDSETAVCDPATADDPMTCAETPQPKACLNHEAGVMCTWAGTGIPGRDPEGDGKPLRGAWLYWPVDVTFTSSGGAYILDWNNHQVREVTADGQLMTVMGTNFLGDGDPATQDLTPTGAPGTSVNLNHPTQLLELPSGNLLLVSWHNHKLREYNVATGTLHVTCGRGAGFAGDGASAESPDARLNQPSAAVRAPDGTLYLLDQRNQRIRRIGPDGVLSTVAGTPARNPTPVEGMVFAQGFGGDGRRALDAQFAFPTGSNPNPAGTLALDSDGRLYVADTDNHRIRRIDFGGPGADDDRIETVIGTDDVTGEGGFAGDGGLGTAARLNNPRDIEFGPDGRLYIADEWNHRIRAWDPESGIITTVAGNGEHAGDLNSSAEVLDGLPPTQARLFRPAGVAFDAAGNLYIADTHHSRIRVVYAGGQP